jgi:hypothetical protein
VSYLLRVTLQEIHLAGAKSLRYKFAVYSTSKSRFVGILTNAFKYHWGKIWQITKPGLEIILKYSKAVEYIKDHLFRV